MGTLKKQGKWLSAPANLDQRPIPIKGEVPHVFAKIQSFAIDPAQVVC
jgi:hypothetical protein